jgi:hypothetical protein
MPPRHECRAAREKIQQPLPTASRPRPSSKFIPCVE